MAKKKRRSKKELRNRLLKLKDGAPDTLCFHLRSKLELNRQDFADLLGIHRETVGSIERGRKPMPLTDRAIKRLAKEKGVSVEGWD